MIDVRTLLLVACAAIASKGAILQRHGVANPHGQSLEQNSREDIRQKLTNRFLDLLDRNPEILDAGQIQHLNKRKEHLQQGIKPLTQHQHSPDEPQDLHEREEILDRQIQQHEDRQLLFQQQKMQTFNQAKLVDAVMAIHNTPLLHLTNLKSAELHIPLPTKTPCEESADKTAKLISQLFGINKLDTIFNGKKPTHAPDDENVDEPEQEEGNGSHPKDGSSSSPPTDDDRDHGDDEHHNEDNNDHGDDEPHSKETNEEGDIEVENSGENEIPDEETLNSKEKPANEVEDKSEESSPSKELQDHPDILDSHESGEKSPDKDHPSNLSGENGSPEKGNKGSDESSGNESSASHESSSEWAGSSEGNSSEGSAESKNDEKPPAEDGEDCSKEGSDCHSTGTGTGSNQENNISNETDECSDGKSDEKNASKQDVSDEKNCSSQEDKSCSEEYSSSEENSHEDSESQEDGSSSSEEDTTSEEKSEEGSGEVGNCEGSGSCESGEGECDKQQEECGETSVGADQGIVEDDSSSDKEPTDSNSVEGESGEQSYFCESIENSGEYGDHVSNESNEPKTSSEKSHEKTDDVSSVEGSTEEDITEDSAEKPKTEQGNEEGTNEPTEEPQTTSHPSTETPSHDVPADYVDYIHEEQEKCGCKGQDAADYEIAEIQPIHEPSLPCEAKVQKFLMSLRPIHIGQIPGPHHQMRPAIGYRRASEPISPLSPDFLTNLLQNAKVRNPQDIASPLKPTTPAPPVSPPASERRSLGNQYQSQPYRMPAYETIPVYGPYDSGKGQYYQHQPYRSYNGQ